KAATEAVPDPFDAPGVRLAFTLYATGQYSYHDVAVAMNRAGYRVKGTHGIRQFTKDTVIWLLQNRFYLGEVSCGYRTDDPKRVWKQGSHEPVIDEVMCESAQRQKRSRARVVVTKSTTQTQPFLLAGLVWCADCHTRMRAN